MTEVKKMEKKKYYKKIFGYFKNEKGLIFVYILTAILAVVINTFTPAISAKTMAAITSIDLKNMIILAFITMILYGASSITRHINNRSSLSIQNKVEIRIKEEVSKELFDLEMRNFDKEGTGFFAHRIESEPRTLAGIFTSIRYFYLNILTSIGVFIYIFWVSPAIGTFLVLTSLINFFIQRHRMKQWENERKESNAMYEKYTSNFGELIRGIKDIKVLNLKDFLIKKTRKEQKEIILFEEKISKKNDNMFLITDFISLVMDFLFIVLGVILIKNDSLAGETFLVLYMYKGRTSYFMSDINNIYRSYKEFNLALERLYELVDNSKYPKETFGKKSLANVEGNISFINVTFGYEDNLVLSDVSLNIEKCQTIGIVGKSGAGKSTILNLINKLYDPKKGAILLDGVDIRELNEKTLRENITTITQNPYIFNMTIKDNLKIANPSASDEEIEEKCRECALDNYIDSLDEGLDTMVGENGVILSGGLKQRLAIARAILKDSKIIMLDEATSSLDNETQDYIHHSIKKIRKDYTIIIIAHRLSTVIDCDKILVLDKGKVVGFDTHENLIKSNKVYRNLYKKELQ